MRGPTFAEMPESLSSCFDQAGISRCFLNIARTFIVLVAR